MHSLSIIALVCLPLVVLATVNSTQTSEFEALFTKMSQRLAKLEKDSKAQAVKAMKLAAVKARTAETEWKEYLSFLKLEYGDDCVDAVKQAKEAKIIDIKDFAHVATFSMKFCNRLRVPATSPAPATQPSSTAPPSSSTVPPQGSYVSAPSNGTSTNAPVTSAPVTNAPGTFTVRYDSIYIPNHFIHQPQTSSQSDDAYVIPRTDESQVSTTQAPQGARGYVIFRPLVDNTGSATGDANIIHQTEQEHQKQVGSADIISYWPNYVTPNDQNQNQDQGSANIVGNYYVQPSTNGGGNGQGSSVIHYTNPNNQQSNQGSANIVGNYYVQHSTNGGGSGSGNGGGSGSGNGGGSGNGNGGGSGSGNGGGSGSGNGGANGSSRTQNTGNVNYYPYPGHLQPYGRK